MAVMRFLRSQSYRGHTTDRTWAFDESYSRMGGLAKVSARARCQRTIDWAPARTALWAPHPARGPQRRLAEASASSFSPLARAVEAGRGRPHRLPDRSADFRQG